MPGTSLTPDHLAELRRLAEEARDHGWRANCCYLLPGGPPRQFNTAVSPDVVLALIADRDEAARREARVRTALREAVDYLPVTTVSERARRDRWERVLQEGTP